MDSLGDNIRKLREDKELPLRTVAAYLDIDQAILSKIERGQRKAVCGSWDSSTWETGGGLK